MELRTTKVVPPPQVKNISVVLTDDQEVRYLNKHYRKLDKTTDVLSFSMLEGQKPSLFSVDLGDIIISLDMASKQARRFKCSFDKEILRLIIHGSLHLFGYDHVKVSPAQVRLMKDLEESLIRKYGGDLHI